MGQRFAGDFFEGVDHFEDGSRVTSAEIVGSEAGFQTTNSSEVSPSEVDDVNIVAKASTVFSIVIVAEDA